MRVPLSILVAFVWVGGAARALEPDEILLLVNRNVPVGTELARFYTTARQIPPGRILELDLPVTEEMSFATYEREVVPAVRRHMRESDLENQIRCIVTFHGVPLRVGPQVLTGPEQQEAGQLARRKAALVEEAVQIVRVLEKHAGELDKTFRAGAGEDVERLVQRADAALKPLVERAATASEPEQRARYVAVLVEAVRRLAGPAGVLRRFGGTADAGEENKVAELSEQIQALATQVARLQEQRHDPAARARLRELVGQGFGVFDEIRIVQAQLDYLDATDSSAAFDSELALLWWNYYPRAKWQANPQHYQMRANSKAATTRNLMVMRLDAPQPGQVREIILASLKAERDGLKGRVVIDSRGIYEKRGRPAFGGYAWYDHSLRELATLIRTRTNLALLHDDSPEVMPAGSADNVAIYCGWYSLQKYQPACRFNAGAVGFHVASFELVSLTEPGKTGWVHGLLNDGVAGTLGAVAEPYLASFPPADDFFPLLLTGRKTLAEVYWETVPMTSWMLTMIGDPLYRPYKANPALAVEDLPARLRALFQTPAGSPAN